MGLGVRFIALPTELPYRLATLIKADYTLQAIVEITLGNDAKINKYREQLQNYSRDIKYCPQT